MSSPRLHSNQVLAEYLRIFETGLTTTLSLKGVYRGNLEWFPAQAISDMANGIWVVLDPGITITPVQLPTDLEVNYGIRIIYVKRINVNENVIQQKIDDINTIVEKLFDEYRLTNLSLTNGQVLWSLPVSVETEPPEEVYVSSIAADLVAAAFRVELKIRTRR